MSIMSPTTLPERAETNDNHVSNRRLRLLTPSRKRIFLFMLRYIDELFSGKNEENEENEKEDEDNGDKENRRNRKSRNPLGNPIPYWICGGTLIGAMRHQGLIPHDDDIDIEILERDSERVKKVFGEVDINVNSPKFSCGKHFKFNLNAGEYHVTGVSGDGPGATNPKDIASGATLQRTSVGHIHFFGNDKFNVDVFVRKSIENDEGNGEGNGEGNDEGGYTGYPVILTDANREFGTTDAIFPLKRYVLRMDGRASGVAPKLLNTDGGDTDSDPKVPKSAPNSDSVNHSRWTTHVWGPGGVGDHLNRFMDGLYGGAWRERVVIWNHGVSIWEDECEHGDATDSDCVDSAGTKVEDGLGSEPQERLDLSLEEYQQLVEFSQGAKGSPGASQATTIQPLPEAQGDDCEEKAVPIDVLFEQLQEDLQQELWIDQGWGSPLPPPF